ncbi:MAG: PBP1A family penicillin-binding protein [Deltaproteobacteria bacterium]|nr:PBP1A family penicillin-binding protein [Deltaproteobacteria bacterium]
MRAVALLLLLAGFAAGLLAMRHVVRLDGLVRERFAGGLSFRVPSQVLSAPTDLYVGLGWRQRDLRDALLRQGYREAPGSSADRAGVAEARGLAPGFFRQAGGSIAIHRRPFDLPDLAEPARRAVVRFANGRIESLRDEGGVEIGTLWLEPEPIGAYHGPYLQHQRRELVSLRELPRHLVHAVLAIEDQRFFQHGGLDLRRIGGAFFANLRAGGIAQGGSTLTQQLAKNFFLTPQRTLRRKANEALIAMLIEARYGKQLILEAYLNEIYLGQRGSSAIHGVGEAARHYFDKPVGKLVLHESALLAAIVQSPGKLAPRRAPEAARRRRDVVLRQMRKQGRIGEGALRAALARPLSVAPLAPEPRSARWFLSALQRQLPDFYDAETLASGGLRIYSTLDLRLQRAARRALTEELERLEQQNASLAPRGGQRLQGCLLALRPQTGQVLALVGGRDYGDSQFDRCDQARRPAGSVFKPFVYAAALEPGPGGPQVTLADHLEDEALEIPLKEGGVWRPRNFDREFHGRVSLRRALEKSYNAAAAGLGQRVGIDRVMEMAQRLGIESTLLEVPSLAIGAADLSPLELARAYATLANGGLRPRLRTFEAVVDPRTPDAPRARRPGSTEAGAAAGTGAGGREVERLADIEAERVLDPGAAWLVTSLLEGVVERGTAAGLRRRGITGPLAAKTGTSSDYRDAWLLGYTPRLVVAVWVGFDEPRSLGLASSSVALPVWARFVKEVTGGRIAGRFARPKEVVEAKIHPESGRLALSGCPERRSEFFLPGTAPLETCPAFAPGRERRWFERFLRRGAS